MSTTDIKGGAARAAYRLHTGLQSQGCVSTMFVLSKHSSDPAVQAFQPPTNLSNRLRHLTRALRIKRSFAAYRNTRPAGVELFSYDRSRYGEDMPIQLPKCDVVNLHWVAGFVDYRSFFSCVPMNTPVVWTLHDMNPFTGGCHYDSDCGRYFQRCGACPQLGSDNAHDLSRQIWRRKRTIFRHIDRNQFHVVTPSRWLDNEAKRSSLLSRFPLSVIPSGLDTDTFAPKSKSIAKDALDLPPEATVLLFVAQSVTNQRKGFALLADALTGLEKKVNSLYLISIGRGNTGVEFSIPHRPMGTVTNDHLLALIYSAADIFIIPSLQDNLPNTVLESLACGTPVVGFDVGGIPDMVRPGVTGLLASVGDVQALSEAITAMLDDPAKRAELSANCRRIAVEEYSLEVQARRYIRLYESMIEANRA